MKQFWPLFKKEIRAYFTSPIFYIVCAVFLALIGYFFVNGIVTYSKMAIQLSGSGREIKNINPTTMVMKPLFNTMGTIFILLTPLITMRLMAEEKRARTMELLMTSPVSLLSIVLSKYLASVFIYTIMIGSTIYMPFVINYFSHVGWSQILSGYMGVMLLGFAMMSVGLFCSSITDKQIIAAVITIGVLVIFWFIGGVLGSAKVELTKILRTLSLFSHFDSLTDGLVDLRDIFYLLSFASVMLFISYRVVDMSRWKG
jgi:ABC-2 type transport system permease protein